MTNLIVPDILGRNLDVLKDSGWKDIDYPVVWP